MSEIPEEKKLLARGFARFVINEGHGAKCPTLKTNGEAMTWQQCGRKLYGAELFNVVLREELAARKTASG